MKTSDFYNGYWEHRKAIGKTLTGEAGRAPDRIGLAGEFLQPVSSRPTRVLDLGCGDGALGDLLRSRGGDYDLVGVDASPVALKLAESGYSHTVCCDIDEEPEKLAALDLASFDYVVALEVVEHLRYPENLLHMLADSCGPDTRFVFSVPNIAWYRYRRQVLRGKLPHEQLYRAGEHLHWFTLDSFREMLGSCGLEVKAVTAKYVYPWVLGLLPGKVLQWLLRRYITLFGNQLMVVCGPSRAGVSGDEVAGGGVAPPLRTRAAGRTGRLRRAATRLRQLTAFLPTVARRVCRGYYRVPSQEKRLLKSEWNVLIVLDACRADAFRRLADPDAPVVRSMAACTRLWVHQFGRVTGRRPAWPDILWVTANPVVDRDCARYDVRGVQLLSLWRTRWGQHGEAGIPSVHPDAVGEEVCRYLEECGQPERMVIHYLQPHAPYIGTPELATGRAGVADSDMLEEIRRLPDPEDAVRRGDLTWQEVREAYDGNLRLVWESVQRLLPHLKGQVIVTADHGELLGEDGLFGHSCRWTTELVRYVPWLTHDGGPYDPAPVCLDEDQATDGASMEDKLRALGYV